MGYNPLVSVIIPTYNSAHFVTHAVDSALAQSYRPIEVIVVDDGSTDDTKVRLAEWLDRIRYIHQLNGGPAKARNRGIKEARGDFLAFLDADDQWLPEKLCKQWECFQANSDAGLVHTDAYQLYEPIGEQRHEKRGREQFSGRCYTKLFWANRITTSTVVVSRWCLERIGQFDEDIREPSAEDLDLWLRIARNYSLAYINEPLVLYRQHLANGSLKQRVMVESEYYVLRKALRRDPGLPRTIGEDKVHRKMFELAFHAGYSNVDVDELARGRRYFWEALAYRPQSVKAWAFWASTFLPLELRKGLRSWKRGFALRRC
jgi:glycosyltransferase involved in cell wall biosynthesis